MAISARAAALERSCKAEVVSCTTGLESDGRANGAFGGGVSHGVRDMQQLDQE